jgi:hypothetical protein
MAEQVLAELGKHGVTGDTVRLVDLDIRPGVDTDVARPDVERGQTGARAAGRGTVRDR